MTCSRAGCRPGPFDRRLAHLRADRHGKDGGSGVPAGPHLPGSALLALTRTFAADLGPEGVRVNMVSGGLLRTTDASAATPDEVFDLIASSTPLRRVVTPDELADTVLFLCSPWSRAVTGQSLVVDGGLVMS